MATIYTIRINNTGEHRTGTIDLVGDPLDVGSRLVTVDGAKVVVVAIETDDHLRTLGDLSEWTTCHDCGRAMTEADAEVCGFTSRCNDCAADHSAGCLNCGGE